jgi:hypothetical protein
MAMKSRGDGEATRGRPKNQKVLLAAPLVVQGQSADDTPFREAASILALNPHGGMLALAAKVRSGQTIVLLSGEAQQEIECRVVYVGPEQNGRSKVAFEFL